MLARVLSQDPNTQKVKYFKGTIKKHMQVFGVLIKLLFQSNKTTFKRRSVKMLYLSGYSLVWGEMPGVSGSILAWQLVFQTLLSYQNGSHIHSYSFLCPHGGVYMLFMDKCSTSAKRTSESSRTSCLNLDFMHAGHVQKPISRKWTVRCCCCCWPNWCARHFLDQKQTKQKKNLY